MLITGLPIQSGDVSSCDFMYANAFILYYTFILFNTKIISF